MKKINWFIGAGLVSVLIACVNSLAGDVDESYFAGKNELYIEQDASAETISVFRSGSKEPLLIQNAKASFRPFLHPISAPDGKGFITEYSPGHHKHQTG